MAAILVVDDKAIDRKLLQVTSRRGRDDLVEMALSREAVALCNDLRATQLNIRLRGELVARGFRSMAVVPLSGCRPARRVLLSDQPGIFDVTELRLLSELSSGLSQAMTQLPERQLAR